jgi:hypothetical protein
MDDSDYRLNFDLGNKNTIPITAARKSMLIFSQGYIFRILQHFAAKLCNFTNFNTLFLVVVMDCVLLA